MVGITYHGTNSVINATAGTSVVVPAPAAMQVGDVLVAFIAQLGVGTVTAPTNWALRGTLASTTALTLAVYTKTVVAGEAASWTWTLSGSARNWGAVSAYGGVDTTNPFTATVGSHFDTSGSSFTVTFGALDRQMVGISAIATVRAATGSATTWTEDAANVERADVSTNAGSGFDIAGALAEGKFVGPVNFGTLYIASQSQGAAVLWAIGLNPLYIPPFPGFTVNVSVEAAMGADLTQAESNWVWTDLTNRLKGTAKITRGRQDEQSQTQPSQLTLRLENTDSALTPRHPLSPWYQQWATGTPIRLKVNQVLGSYTRFQGYVDTITPLWPAGNSNVAHIEVHASGIMRQLNQGRVFRSAMVRGLSAATVNGSPHAPVRYWPVEDERGATRAAEFFGFASLVPSNPIDFGADSQLSGSAAIATVPAGTSIGSAFAPPLANEWRVECVVSLPAQPAATTTMLEWFTQNSPVVRWRVRITNANPPVFFVEGFNSAGTEVFGDTGVAFDVTQYTKALFLVINAQRNHINSSNLDWGYALYRGDQSIVLQQFTTSSGIAPGQVTSVKFAPDTNLDNAVFGHLAIFPEADLISGSVFVSTDVVCVNGHAGEDPLTRMQRLCGEEDVPFSNVEAATNQFPMGAQTASTLIALLRQCEDVEGGILTDGLNAGLDYLSRANRSNQTAAFSLNGKAYQLKLPFEPVEDDQRLRNDVTVSRMGGSSARATDETSISESGDYEESVDLNLFTDDQTLIDQANQRLAIGTWPEMRVPAITIDLRNDPELIRPWLEEAFIGCRYSATNLPTQYVPGQLDQILESYTETIDAVTWTVDLVGSPYGPWRIITLAADSGDTGENICHLDSDDSELMSAIGTTDTTFSVASNSGPLWTIAADDFPMDVNVEGEQIRVSNIVMANDTFTRTTSNGWGSTDAGQPYSLVGSASQFSTNGSEGIMACNSISGFAALIAGPVLNFDVTVTKIAVSAAPTGGNFENVIVGRRLDASNFVDFRIFRLSAGGITCALRQMVNGVETFSAFPTVAGLLNNDTVSMRFKADGTNLFGKVWKNGTGEPTAWSIAFAVNWVTPGALGVMSSLDVGVTNTLPVNFNFDNITYNGYHVVTATRSVNGVAKTHPAGAAVNIWNPPSLGL